MKRLRCLASVAILCVLPVSLSSASIGDPVQVDTPSAEATIWHLGHCGYAIQTENHLLIFDYIELEETVPDKKGLDEGFVDASALKDLNVTVFVTHEHIDHYDEVIFEWKEEIESIEYVFGWEAIRGPGYHNMPGPRDMLRVGDMEIYTVNSFHAYVPEVAYLVKVDGLTIYHGGDYQGRPDRGAPSNAQEDMEYLKAQTDSVDLFFIGAWTGDPYMTSIRVLNPRVIFPMHERKHEERYKQFAADLAELGVEQPVMCPEKRGDRFVYSNGTIR